MVIVHVLFTVNSGYLETLLLHKIILQMTCVLYINWFCANKLLNAQKTNFMVFSPKNNHTNITSLNLENQMIQKVNCAKFLGIFIDDELKWSVHTNHVLKMVSSGPYALHSVKRFISSDNMKTRRGSRGGAKGALAPPPHFLGKKQGGQKPHTQKKKRSKSDYHEARYRLKRTTKHTKYAKIF